MEGGTEITKMGLGIEEQEAAKGRNCCEKSSKAN
jgi:hypothetical protein